MHKFIRPMYVRSLDKSIDSDSSIYFRHQIFVKIFRPTLFSTIEIMVIIMIKTLKHFFQKYFSTI